MFRKSTCIGNQKYAGAHIQTYARTLATALFVSIYVEVNVVPTFN